MALLNNPRRALAALDARAGLPGFGAPLLGGFTFDERRRKKRDRGGGPRSGGDGPRYPTTDNVNRALACCSEAELSCCGPDSTPGTCVFECTPDTSSGTCRVTACEVIPGGPFRIPLTNRVIS
jgi:hypothetical protein